jgi:Tol biopolymer transport system component
MYSIDISGDVGSVVRLTSEATRDENPAWLPDDSYVVYNTDRGGNMDLWMVSADGNDLVQLTDDEYYDLYPDYWMP